MALLVSSTWRLEMLDLLAVKVCLALHNVSHFLFSLFFFLKNNIPQFAFSISNRNISSDIMHIENCFVCIFFFSILQSFFLFIFSHTLSYTIQSNFMSEKQQICFKQVQPIEMHHHCCQKALSGHMQCSSVLLFAASMDQVWLLAPLSHLEFCFMEKQGSI